MGQLGVSVALDHPSSDSIFALAAHAQFYFALFVKSKFRRKKKIYFFLSLSFFFSLSFSSFSLRFTVAWPILPPSKMHWKRAICRFPLLMYFQKTLQSDINCFDCMHLFVITHCCPTLLPVFFFPLQVIILHYTQIFVYNQLRGSQQRSLPAIRALKAEMFWSHFSVGNTFHTYQVISCVQMGPTHTTLLKLAPLQIPSIVAWVGCRRFKHITFSIIFANVQVVDCMS